jgi:teichuronic acid biosynthesis glycosyltransferase TuaG
MNSVPVISIIMPAYNAASFISDAIESVLGQTFPNFELIVVNDCSADNTADIVKKYLERDSRVHLINLMINMGAPAGPRNIGIKESIGKWVAFLDADDIWYPTKLQRQIEVLEHTGSYFCSTKMLDFVDLTKIKLHDASPDDYEWITFHQQLIKMRTPTSSVVVDRELMINNLFNEDNEFKAREDMDCWLRCHEVIGSSVKIRAPMVGYRLSPNQISGNKLEMIKRHFYVLSRYRFLSGKKMGIMAWFYTFTHIALSIYIRKALKQL